MNTLIDWAMEVNMAGLILIFCACVLACTIGNVTEKLKEIMPTYLVILWLGIVVVGFGSLAFMLNLGS